MFKMYCSKCGEKLPDDSKFCTKCGATVGREARTETVVGRFETDTDLQEYWIKRGIAYIIDSIIVGIAAVVLLGIAFFPAISTNPASLFDILGFPFAMGLLYILYFPVAETMYGATFGKSMMGFKVVTRTGGRPSFEKSFIRNVTKIHQVLLLLDVIGGLITSTELHQKYTDRIANTTVVAIKDVAVWKR
jgi:uncharacterized RDD family membrane protein YckC/ribosomal protein L40E